MKCNYDVAIIGGGPAGMTAAIYVARAGLSTVVFEAVAVGGQIINSADVANYPAAPHISGVEFGRKLDKQAREMGVEIKFEKVKSIRLEQFEQDSGDEPARYIVETERDKYLARAVVIATGASHRRLGLPGENELVGRGISYCATCDGGFYKGKTVAVMGGGDTALDDALYLAKLAEKVYLIHRRDEFRGSRGTVEKLQRLRNVEFVLDSVVTEFLVEDGKLMGVKVVDKAREERTLGVAGLFVAIGQVPATEAFSEILELDEAGYILASESCRTELPGVFVAGDVRTKTTRQLVTATADGAVAAEAVVEYLH